MVGCDGAERVAIATAPNAAKEITMKIKTHSGAKKRFKLTGGGKIKRKKAFTGHLLECKNSSRKRRLGKQAYVHSANMDDVRRMLVL